MDDILESISEFIGNIVAAGLVGGSIFLFAGEIRLAALKKASHGSARLSTFTEKMTKTQLPLIKGGNHENGIKPH